MRTMPGRIPRNQACIAVAPITTSQPFGSSILRATGCLWHDEDMNTYHIAREGPDWVVIATRADKSQESLTRHSTEAEAGTMADRLTEITLARKKS